jgi:hypothetical protein
LADGYDQASSEAAAHEDGHDAEVKNHGSLSVHMLNFNIFLLAQRTSSGRNFWVNIVLKLQNVRSQDLVVLLLHLL